MALIEVNVNAVTASMDRNVTQALSAAGRALGMVGLAVERQAIANASGPVVKSGNHKTWAGAGPNMRTGWLRKNIRSGKPVRQGFESYTVEVFSMASYSRAVEEGTGRTGKYPFMRPALATIETKAEQIFQTAYNRFRTK
jgi:HK97 gp10 family phage protein